MKPTVREATYDLLRQLGLTTIFGNPGSTEEPFLQDFPKDFTYVLGLQEASVLAMADGYAQATRRPALVNLHTFAGVGHAMGNLICAFYNKTPLIITAGQQTREMALLEPYLTNVQAVETPRPWVKWSYEPVRPGDIPAAFMRAYATAVQPPAGPVFLSLPLDDFEKPALGDPVVRTQSQRVGPDPDRLREFARQIGQAKSPVLILGASLDRSGGWEAVQRFAEKLNVPVWVPPETERAVFPEEHPLFQGFLPFAIAPLSKKLEGHDLVLVIGAPVFRYYPYVPGEYLPTGARLLHITDDPSEAARAPVGDSLLSDSRLALEELLELVEPGQYPPVPPRAAKPDLAKSSGTLLMPAEVFATVQANRPDDAVFLIESTSNAAEFHKWVPITQPNSFSLFASGGLGWALPAAVGFALAERDTGRNRPVLVVLGDGAANYSIQALYTAAQHQLPVVFLILCNQEYGILKAFADQQKAHGVPGLDLPGLDFVALARGYGCAAFRVPTSDDLAEALQAALHRAGPTVLEIPITAAVAPLL
jgi:benzoylformate decarboxylase